MLHSKIYCGQDKVEVVQELMEQNLDKGVILYTDNGYTSLKERKAHLAGTLRKTGKVCLRK